MLDAFHYAATLASIQSIDSFGGAGKLFEKSLNALEAYGSVLDNDFCLDLSMAWSL